MPTIAQRCARRLPFGWTVEKTGVVASRTAMAPALAVDGDFVVQRAITLLIALRSVLADTLPARLAFGLVPTRAFDPSTGSIVSALSDGELSTSHAWLNNPTATGLAQSPRKWGVSSGYASYGAALPAPLQSLGRGRRSLPDPVHTKMWRFRNVRRTHRRSGCSTVSCSVPRRALFSQWPSSNGIPMQTNLTAFAALAPPAHSRPCGRPAANSAH